MGYGRLRACSALVAVLLLSTGCSREFTVAVSPFEIKVVDEEGQPLEEALVVASYRTSYGAHDVVDGVLHVVEQRTDAEGVARFSGWEKETTRGFGQGEPTITVIKFGWLTHYDGTTSERDRTFGLYRVWDVKPAIQDPVELKSCKDQSGRRESSCMSDAYRKMTTDLGPVSEKQMKELKGFAKERAKYEVQKRDY